MQEKKQINPPINPGISLLLVVFLVLCLFTFSAITLATAISEHKRSQSLAENTRAYYAACNQAEHQLSALRNTLQISGSRSIDEPLEYEFEIDETQSLFVRIEPDLLTSTNKPYRITKWQILSKGDWKTKDTMELFVPGM